VRRRGERIKNVVGKRFVNRSSVGMEAKREVIEMGKVWMWGLWESGGGCARKPLTKVNKIHELHTLPKF